ncbi:MULTISPECIES: DUF3718 domain-containing protein [Pseudoalteromonas]|uniref:DUF3718 domain-containing protein n=1 Tax=Pseudoalteromonas TaxID=53246 RepID=UPI00026CBB87|nr:DUF3718 domain-containing protein [Pseudoalteromonas spongiae]ATC97845.1 hypothetical protein PSPO_a0651 [Pseudoalteromonas spongiae UST010723-006]
MKLSTLLFTLSVSSAALLSSHTVNANEQLAASICDYVAADDKSRIRKKLKESRVKLRNIYAGISCGGNNLIRHAIVSGADGVGEYIVKQLPKSDLAAGGDVAWADANGHSSSAVIAALKDRAGI